VSYSLAIDPEIAYDKLFSLIEISSLNQQILA